MISGKTTLIAHLGYPTEAFKAPMIYNPWFDKQGIDAVVVPMGVKPEDFDLVINATALGLNDDDPLPVEVERMAPHAALFDILLRNQPTALVRAARARGLVAQAGFEMLIQQMPHYLRYFGHDEAAEALGDDADFLRELIYPPSMRGEIVRSPR